MGKVTLRELAEALDVSIATVSFALNGSPQVSEKTRRDIQRFAAARGYRPNHFGRALQARSGRLVGFITRAVTTSFFGALLQGAGYEAARHRYGLLTGLVKADDDLDLGVELEHAIQTMLDKTVDGLIFAVEPVNLVPYRELLAHARIPVVFCSIASGGMYPEVLTDDVAGGEMAARHLLEQGCRRLAASDIEPRRLSGNRRAVADAAGATLHTFSFPGDFTALLDAHPDLDGVLAYCDLHAVEIIRALRARGRRVPEDVAVVGYDGSFFNEWPEFELSTVRQLQNELGQSAFLELHAAIEHGGPAQSRLLSPVLEARASSRRAPANADRPARRPRRTERIGS